MCGASDTNALKHVSATVTAHAKEQLLRERAWLINQGWEADLPVILCLVDTDDGARMYAQLTGCDPADVHIGMRVEVHFEDISDQAGIPKFRPLDTKLWRL